tara:strand:- start:3767 stop:3937 length:171 start_codon:yes stop_codon:yes gene_type:complete
MEQKDKIEKSMKLTLPTYKKFKEIQHEMKADIEYEKHVSSSEVIDKLIDVYLANKK